MLFSSVNVSNAIEQENSNFNSKKIVETEQKKSEEKSFKTTKIVSSEKQKSEIKIFNNYINNDNFSKSYTVNTKNNRVANR